MTDTEKFDQWLRHHPCTAKELWLLQNCLGSMLHWQSELHIAAKDAWQRSREMAETRGGESEDSPSGKDL